MGIDAWLQAVLNRYLLNARPDFKKDVGPAGIDPLPTLSATPSTTAVQREPPVADKAGHDQGALPVTVAVFSNS